MGIETQKFGFGLKHLLAIAGCAFVLIIFVLVQNGFKLPNTKSGKLQAVGVSASKTTPQPEVAKPIINRQTNTRTKAKEVPRIIGKNIKPRG